MVLTTTGADVCYSSLRRIVENGGRNDGGGDGEQGRGTGRHQRRAGKMHILLVGPLSKRPLAPELALMSVNTPGLV